MRRSRGSSGGQGLSPRSRATIMRLTATSLCHWALIGSSAASRSSIARLRCANSSASVRSPCCSWVRANCVKENDRPRCQLALDGSTSVRRVHALTDPRYLVPLWTWLAVLTLVVSIYFLGCSQGWPLLPPIGLSDNASADRVRGNVAALFGVPAIAILLLLLLELTAEWMRRGQELHPSRSPWDRLPAPDLWGLPVSDGTYREAGTLGAFFGDAGLHDGSSGPDIPDSRHLSALR